MAKPITDYSQIIGHQRVVSYIKGIIEKDRIPDVMIFYGNPGLGKSSLAKLLAVDTVTMYDKSRRESYIESVVQKGESTDSIKLFNMSQIQEKEEEIQKVKAELSVGFTSTKRKVLILDEAHNMSNKAQDAILTDLEFLPDGVFVFICTTEIGALRDALISRSKASIQLRDLNEFECKALIRREISDRRLSFDMSTDMVCLFISSWANNQPRKVLNLLDNFENGSTVKSRDLEVFVNVQGPSAVIELVKYLYGSISLGINYIDSLTIDATFVTLLVEITRVVLGGTSDALSKSDIIFLRNFMEDKDEMVLLKFCTEVASLDRLLKRRVIAAFMRSHIKSVPGNVVVPREQSIIKADDYKLFSENLEKPQVSNLDLAMPQVVSLEEMMSMSSEVE